MMNVLICDDEAQIREGLKMKVNWEEKGFTIAEEASNGQEALDKLNDHNIDIVITDVRMPVMNGIEFAEKCRNFHPHVKVIVLSGYSDFEYAKSSLKAGVKDYLLKPIAPKELVETLEKVRRDIEEQRISELKSNKLDLLLQDRLEVMREQFLVYLVKDEYYELMVTRERLHQLSLDNLVHESNHVQFLTFEIRVDNPEQRNVNELFMPFKMITQEYLRDYDQMYTFHDASYANMVHVIISDPKRAYTASSNLVRGLQRKVKEFLGVEIVVGFGEIVTGKSRFKNGYVSSLLAWSQSQVGNYSKITDYEINTFDFPAELEKRMINTVENRNLLLFKTVLHDVLVNHQSMMSFSFKANRILFLIGSLMKKYDFQSISIQKQIWACQQAIWELNSQHKVIEQLTQLAEQVMEKVKEIHSSSTGTELVEKVRTFITKHYADEITLSTLSEQFHINNTYLSEIFKLNIGKNFSEYLNDMRMEQAKKLLKDPHLKIIDVAHLVGFANSSYFSTVFKKNIGMTPAEYRKVYQA